MSSNNWRWRALRQEIEAMVPLVRLVMQQTRAPIFRGDTQGHPGEDSCAANQIVRGRGEDEKPNDQFAAAMTGLAHPPSVLIQPNGSSIRFH
jgi:hypothetical protein